MYDWNAIIDISWPISTNMTEYKNRKTVMITPATSFEEQRVRETVISMHSHTGTHVDAPAHFLAQGAYIESLALSKLVGPCVVLDLMHCNQKIDTKDLRDCSFQENDIVLLKTKNSALSSTESFHTQFVYLTAHAAEYIVNKKIKSVGIDYLGIERDQAHHETHIALLAAHIPIIEGLRLAQVTPGRYQLICLPLALHSVEAAPARAILLPFR